jgi:hypothetical protein
MQLGADKLYFGFKVVFTACLTDGDTLLTRAKDITMQQDVYMVSKYISSTSTFYKLTDKDHPSKPGQSDIVPADVGEKGFDVWRETALENLPFTKDINPKDDAETLPLDYDQKEGKWFAWEDAPGWGGQEGTEYSASEYPMAGIAYGMAVHLFAIGTDKQQLDAWFKFAYVAYSDGVTWNIFDNMLQVTPGLPKHWSAPN